MRVFRYSTKRFRNATKCSAFLIFPGTASFKRSSGSTIEVKHKQVEIAYPDSRHTGVGHVGIFLECFVCLLKSLYEFCIFVLKL